jgi:hypothetical protein
VYCTSTHAPRQTFERRRKDPKARRHSLDFQVVVMRLQSLAKKMAILFDGVGWFVAPPE